MLDFLYDERLHYVAWHFVTIRVAGWTVPPGGDRPFGQLRDQPCIYALMAKFRRMKIDDLLIFGSLETVYVTVDNVPAGKPFHIHLMVSGASEAEITKAVNTSITLDFSVPRPLRVDPVLPTDKDFFRCASYAFKQPLAKKSKASMDDDGVRQLLKPAERREIILNYGVHGWRDRLILLGIRCDNGPFRLIANLSTTARSAISTRLRKLRPGQSRRPPTGQG
ncbi:conjugal transfer protein TraG N-terminal domain-containing protein [Mesorhizobium sp. ES1-4]|uniref:conjugal transfer protein TraG N-terminal domain-containing protein n=1 Tax=Mesorhizobium sp. ES1-4 TaxID=2876627 RepID=UPI001CCEA73E|nr:conjugal transfer protein TraG N-terminal domain-containing protein [Mesorhizobium sp. ES1-4]MBZ9795597.1 conjugal transfer protein TraG N-terminal domain-containing protein [Mesorhizobium sp. ES1-4]